MATNTIAQPVRTLYELVTRLEAAITLTLARPKPRAVHHLRTTTRRIEAQLELLLLLPELPEHAKPAEKSRRLLARIRRAAGRVRDLDVQRDLTQSGSSKLHHDADHLRNLFERRRDEEADRLLRTIEKHQRKLTRSLEKLLKAFAPAESFTLSISQLSELTIRWYVHHVPAIAEGSDQLHTIRKSGKMARYMAESAIKSAPPTRRLAQTFESLQQSGGEWHDWLTLSEIAKDELGSSSLLAQAFTRRCEKSLSDYRGQLKSLPGKLSVTKRSPGA